MNLVILYVLCFFAIMVSLLTGYFVSRKAQGCLEELANFENEKAIVSKEFSNIVIKNNKLKNLAILPLRAKKTNYYCAKYNVIKLSPNTLYSGKLIDLAISARCLNQAKRQQTFYISSTLWSLTLAISKFFMLAFLPTVLISAILNITFGLKTIAYFSTLVALICFCIAFLIHFIYYFIDNATNKQTIIDISETSIFNEHEITALYILLHSLSQQDFFRISRLSLKFASLINPAHYAEPEDI